MFNAQPTGTVILRQYTLQSLLIIKDKTWLVKRIWVFDTIKMAKLKKKKSLYGCHANKPPKIRSTIVLSQLVK